jgi:hypothetical protein
MQKEDVLAGFDHLFQNLLGRPLTSETRIPVSSAVLKEEEKLTKRG